MKALEGRVAIISGGARGVGAAISRALHANGARVVVADNGASIDGRVQDAAVAVEFVRRLGDGAIAFTEDIASSNAAGLAVDFAVKEFGRLDIIVNNAAILRDAFLFKANPVDFEAVWRVNLFAAFELLRMATPVLRDQAKGDRGGAPYRWGRIINVVSSAGLYGNYGQAAYASAKAGLLGLTRVAALDMARSGVTANAIAPFAASRVTESIIPANDAQAEYKKHGLTISPDYVGRFAAFLATDAARSITGQLFGVRGREVFLFSQPRPVVRVTVKDDSFDELERIATRDFAPHFTPLETDLEAFSHAPIV
ncbi:MAG TPA: SDR family NAD(P)-dependent oxidoreductase [Candidatus Binatia bacterium]|nr:SDR family NAD(P)-dependent oxidoreductase [Candidatus Binatia bacterium]